MLRTTRLAYLLQRIVFRVGCYASNQSFYTFTCTAAISVPAAHDLKHDPASTLLCSPQINPNQELPEEGNPRLLGIKHFQVISNKLCARMVFSEKLLTNR